MTNAALAARLDTAECSFVDRKRPDFVIFFDKDVRLASVLQAQGLRLYNGADAVAACDDKGLTHLRLAGVAPMPRTLHVPATFPAIGWNDLSFLSAAGDCLGYPMVIKECFGSFGAQVHLARDRAQAERILADMGGRPAILQEFVAESAGRDVRLQVVGGRVIASMARTGAEGDFRSNLSGGGRMARYEPSAEETTIALRACETLNLAFAGVDFLHGAKGSLLCEINSNAHFKNIQTLTGVDVARAILAHAMEMERAR